MIPYHLSAEQTASDRGFAFGRAQAEGVQNTVSAYGRIFHALHGLGEGEIANLGDLVGSRIERDWPTLREEIEAIAAGAKVDARALLAANARTEIFAGAMRPECSAIGILPEATPDRSTILAQNWDWHPDLARSRVLWRVVETDGSWFLTLTEAGLLAKIGLNSRGLGVCLNILSSSLDGGVGGQPIHVLLRAILQFCGDLSQALVILLNAEATASSCFNLGFAAGDHGALASVELSPAGAEVLWPDDAWLLHTNHFLRPVPGGEDRMRREWPDTLVRLDELRRRMKHDRPASMGEVEGMLQSHFDGPIAICCHDPENMRYIDQQATLASIILDLKSRRLLITDGAPCVAPYDDFPALKSSEVQLSQLEGEVERGAEESTFRR